MSKEIKEELQDYLNQKNINQLFVAIVEAILVDKPGKKFLAFFVIVLCSYACSCSYHQIMLLDS